MRIQRVSRLLITLTVAMLMGMGATLWSALQLQERMAATERRGQRAQELAAQLLQSSEDLTRMARSYVATGEGRYQDLYYEILDMRNGLLPRPRALSPTYWHLAGVGRGAAVEFGPPEALRKLMDDEGMHADDLALLRQSQADSDALVAVEERAFAVLRGVDALTTGAHAAPRVPDAALALRLLHDDAYEDAKARIMQTVQRFMDAVQARHAIELARLGVHWRLHVWGLLAWVVVLLSGVVLYAFYSQRAILGPLQQLAAQVRRLRTGQYAARSEVAAANELRELSGQFNAMAQAFEEDLERRNHAERATAQAMDALASRELLLQKIFDTSSAAIFLVNLHGQITHANACMAHMFGCSLDALRALHYPDLLDAALRETGRHTMAQLLQGEVALVEVERRYRRRDGDEFWGHLTGRRFLDNAGQVQGLVGVIVDITPRKRAQLQQQLYNRIWQLLADQATQPLLLEALVQGLQQLLPEARCAITLRSDDGQHQQWAAAPDWPPAVLGHTQAWPAGWEAHAHAPARSPFVMELAQQEWWTVLLALGADAALRTVATYPMLGSGGQVLGTLAAYRFTSASMPNWQGEALEDAARLGALALEKLRNDIQLQFAAKVFSHAREGIVIADAAGLALDANAAFTRITGYARAEVLGQRAGEMLNSGRQDAAFFRERRRVLEREGFWSGEVWNRRKNGEEYAELLTITAVRDAHGQMQNHVALFSDITPQKEQQSRLEHIAHFDALTHLPNRVLLADRLQQALTQCLRRGLSVAVVYLDLDGFKAVNDQCGHSVGDALLVALAQRMKAALREGDTLARIGGDEFVAVLGDLDQVGDAQPVLERLLGAAAAPVPVDGHRLQVSASLGVTSYPQDGVEVEQLLRHADQAMYLAKQAGKNRCHWFDVVQETAVQSLRQSVDAMRHALQRQELRLYYQPKVRMRDGAVLGAEALIRWQHPERGLLAPGAFLPAIENHPIALDIGDWVLECALRQLAQWNAVGFVTQVSVNVGARQLQQGHFVSHLMSTLQRYPQVAPAQLELEILESSALQDLAEVYATILACQSLGVRFALDDFGTGYSSLSHLRHLPAETIKIDQSFVRDMLGDGEDLAIVKGVIGLAQAFGRELIAEGVETVEHGLALLALGCELAQGYVIAKPMPPDDFMIWSAQWRPDVRWQDRGVGDVEQYMDENRG